MPIRKLKQFLEAQEVHFESIRHPQTFTAQRTAESIHVKGREMAKTVMVHLDGELAMVVLPAPGKLDLGKLKAVSGAEEARLAKEEEFEAQFPECEIGAMPPFGRLYGMTLYAQEDLRDDMEIAFNAGTHTEVIKMGYADFERLASPAYGDFAQTALV